MGAKNEITYKVNFEAETSALTRALNSIQSGFSKLNVSKTASQQMDQLVTDVTADMTKIQQITAKGYVTEGEAKEVYNIQQHMNNLLATIQRISGVDLGGQRLKETSDQIQALTNVQRQWNTANKEYVKIQKDIGVAQKKVDKLQADVNGHSAQAEIVSDLEAQQKAYEELQQAVIAYEESKADYRAKNGSKKGFTESEEGQAAQKRIDEAQAAIRSKPQDKFSMGSFTFDPNKPKQNLKAVQDAVKGIGDETDKATVKLAKMVNPTSELDQAKADLQSLQDAMAKLPTGSDNYSNFLNQYSESLERLKIDPSTVDTPEKLEAVLKQMATTAESDAAPAVEEVKEGVQGAGEVMEEYGTKAKGAVTVTEEMASSSKKLEDTMNKIKRVFSMDNAISLFKRSIQSAITSIKELDASMTETAIVTNFTVSDMWDQMPDYTAKANELGVAIKDVYDAATLYYQQGLSTQEVNAVTTQTLELARIASLDASTATDRLTNAMRAFNMTIDESSAQNVVDVYSKLAAISASNVKEISNAMTKVASLADSANMSFENTSAFLAQIIETTRESA